MRFKLFSLVTLSTLTLLTAGITGCSKSSGSSSGAGVSATVGSSGFSPSTTAAFYGQSELLWELAGYSITSGDTTALILNIPAPATVNTAMTTLNSGIGVEYYVSGGKDYVAQGHWGSATLTVTSLDTTGHKIAGTFSGSLWNVNNANDSLKVSNGHFNTSYLVEP